jgi:phosphotransferase system HPr (HPr) family protein
MISQTLKVHNKIGIHSRPAALLVDASKRYASVITITHGERSATTDSLTRILALRVKMNSEITIQAEGNDENEAIETIVNLINSGFGED